MDSSSSNVGFPLSGNPESPGNSPPLHSSSVRIPHSENPQPTATPPPQHSSSSPVGNPLSESPQSTEAPPNRQFSNNRSRSIIPDAQWNEDLANLFYDNGFCLFMRGGECEDPFIDWYGCMYHAVYHGGNLTDCSNLSAVLRECIYANLNYYNPLLCYLRNRPHRR